eukprot:3214336-Rhodomonas_salina.1
MVLQRGDIPARDRGYHRRQDHVPGRVLTRKTLPCTRSVIPNRVEMTRWSMCMWYLPAVGKKSVQGGELTRCYVCVCVMEQAVDKGWMRSGGQRVGARRRSVLPPACQDGLHHRAGRQPGAPAAAPACSCNRALTHLGACLRFADDRAGTGGGFAPGAWRHRHGVDDGRVHDRRSVPLPHSLCCLCAAAAEEDGG